MGASRFGPPLVDKEWRAICQAIYQGVEGAELENLHYNFVELNKEVNVRNTWKCRAITIWKMRDAGERCDTYYDQTYANNEPGEAVRPDLWNAHLRSTTWEDVNSSAGGATS